MEWVRDVTDHRLAEDALRESEEKFRGMTEQMSELIGLTDMDGRISYASGAIQTMFQYTPEEVIGRHFTELLDESDIPKAVASFTAAIKKGEPTVKLELKMKKRDGSLFYGELNGSLFKAGAHQGTLVVIRDISERKHAELALRNERERLQFIIDGSRLGTWEWDVRTNRTVFNERWAEMLGYTIMELEPYDYGTWAGLVHPDDLIRAEDSLRQCTEGRASEYECEFRMRHSDGRWVWILDRGRVMMRDPDGRPLVMYGTHTDITEMKRIEDDLRGQRDFLRQVIDTIPGFVCVKTLEGRFSLANRALCDAYGTTAAELEGRGDADFSPLPEEIEDFLSDDRRVILKKETLFIPEEKITYADGTAHWLSTIKSPLINSDGTCSSLLAVAMDITDLKNAERARKDAEHRYRVLIDNSQSIIYTLGADGTVTFVSPSWKRSLGHNPEEVIGRALRSLVHTDDLPAWDRCMDSTIRGENIQNGVEYRVLRKDGMLRWHSSVLTPLFGEEHELLSIVGNAVDITDYKIAEEDLRGQLKEIEALLRESHHRIKNNIASIMGLLGLQAGAASNPEVQSALREAAGRAASIRDLYEKMLISGEYREIMTAAYLGGLADSITALFAGPVRITLERALEDFPLNSKQLFSMGIILNELLTNALKHAFTGRKTGMVRVASARKNGRIILSIHDDGNGLPAGFDADTEKGFGLTLVRMLCRQMGGSFTVKAGAGTTCTLEFDDTGNPG